MTDIAALEDLISEYWSLAYAEGKEGRTHDTEDGAAQRKWSEIQAAIRQLAPVPAQPTITPEQARDAQQWAGVDGATAWHLIDTDASDWADVGAMMDAWLEANRSPVPAQGAEGVEALAREIGETERPPTEEDRIGFEAWMSGHRWKVEGKWNGGQYVHETEGHPTRMLHQGAMTTRRLFAAWRDRGELERRLHNSPESPDRSLREDAERYRFLRDPEPFKKMGDGRTGLILGNFEGDLDAAIDVARSTRGDNEA